ncbi:RNA 3'-terminal phosphate cyclase [Tetrabaena socialis]|uniref:RNA 3'-terminal phosphate cyclase n=1 Tax=Tetrabaena socialis TaxID=47790 RepID=A0A2J7ZHZ4_9CHLO|nr:RNA 3'-terminal phosphate cyclase [Tetrabaena socialis]|eukprot:PNG99891.1 RNA 3'-terminal phosphate cyclase [Tetrabaena socialis]
MQDQLIIWMALAAGVSRVRCTEPTLHTRTAMVVAETLLPGVKFLLHRPPGAADSGVGAGDGGCAGGGGGAVDAAGLLCGGRACRVIRLGPAGRCTTLFGNGVGCANVSPRWV